MNIYFSRKLTLYVITTTLLMTGVFLLAVENIYAQTVWKQQLVNTSLTDSEPNVTIQYIGTGDGTSINSATLYIDNSLGDQSSSPRSISITTCDNGTWNEATNVCSSGLSYSTTNSSTFTIDAGYVGFITSTFDATTTSALHDYYVVINSNTPLGEKYGGSINENAYVNGSYEDGFDNVKDLYFKVGTNLTSEELSFVFPINEQLLSNKFINYYLNVNIATSTLIGNNFSIGVRYGTSTNLGQDTAEPLLNFNATATPVFAPNLTTGDWYARGYVSYQDCNFNGGSFTCTSYDVATTSLIQFTLLTEECENIYCDPYLGTPTFNLATSTGNSIYENCINVVGTGGFLNFWGSGFCGGVHYLFTPNNKSYEQMKTALDGFKEVFPFSIVYDVKDVSVSALGVGSATSSSNMHWNLTIAGETIDTEILDVGWWDTIGQGSVKDQYFAVIEMIIWLGLGIGLVRQII